MKSPIFTFTCIIALMFGLITAASAQLVPTQEYELTGFPTLQSYYPLEKNSNDESTNGFHFNDSIATLTVGKHNTDSSAYDFLFNNGILYNYGGLNWLQNGEFTANLWIQNNDTVYYNAVTLLYQGDTVADMWFGIEDGRFSFSRTGAVETDVWKSVDSLQLNQWHMLTANIKVDTSVHVQLFIDGVETDTTHATTYDFYHQIMPLNHLAGAYDMYGMNTFNGKIDDIKVFNQQLTPTQIFDMYNYESLAQRNLTLWVDMSYQEMVGNFNPGADAAYVSGSFNAWGMTPLTDMGGGLFETTISNQNISDTIYFNFGYSNNDGEYYEDLGGTDRMWVVKDLNNTLDYVYNNEWYDTNMALVSIDEPQSLSNAASDTVRVMVQNRGFNTLTDFVLSYDIDAGIPVIDTVNLTLNPGEYYNHTFSVPADFSLSGTYTLNVSVSVLSDENPSDDMLSKVIQNTATTGINFFVDMTYQIGLGNFDPAFDSLDVSGSFNGWSSPGNWLTDANNDSIYEVYIDGLNTLEEIEYKFRFNGDWSQPHEFPGGENRIHFVDKLNDTLYHVFNDEDFYKNLGVLFVSSPSAMSSGAAEVVEVMLQNRGFADVDTFDISYILDGAAPVTENVVANIPFGDEWSYAFANTIDVSTEGVHTLKIYTSLPGDEDTADDTVLYFINNLPEAAALPYTETFDSASSTWSIGGVNSSWERGIPSKTTFSSDKFSSQAMVTSLNSTIAPNEQSYVVSPVFQGPFTNVAVEFSYMVETNWQAGAAIQYSTDGGNTWMRLADNWTVINGNADEIWALDWSGDIAGFFGNQPFWKEVIYPLGDLGGATEVLFRVAFGSEPSLDGAFDGFAFDNFKFYEKPEKDMKLHVAKVEHDLNQVGDEMVSFMAFNAGALDVQNWTVEAHLENGEVYTQQFIDYYISPGTEVREGIGINVANLSNGPYNVTLVIASDTAPGALTDTLVVSGVKSSEITGYPFVDDFESTPQWGFINEESPYTDWMGIESPIGDTISTAYSGSKALTTSNQNQGAYRTTLAAISPWFKFDTLLRPTMSFAIFRELNNQQALGIQYRTRDTDWQQLGYYDEITWYNAYLDDTYNIYWYNQYEAWAYTFDTTWTMVSQSFDQLAGLPEVQFRFLYSVYENWEKNDGFAIDDFTVFDDPYAYDLAVAELKSPKSGISQPGNDTIRVVLENKGTSFITNIDIEYSIDTTYVTETITDTIFSGETFEYVFNQTADLSAVGQYYINVNLYVPSDENSANDYLSEDINILPIISSLPYTQDFELGPGDWVISGEDYTYSWEYGTPAGEAINSAASGSFAFMTMLTGAYYDNEMSYVQSPFFDLSTLTAPFVKLDFWSQTGDLDDGALLQYTTNNGNTWNTIGSQHSTPAWYNWTSDPAEGGLSTIGEYEYWTDNTNGWQTAMHPITELAGEPMVSFRVLFASDDSDNNYDGFAFDNFMVSDALLGYTDDFNDSILTNWNWEPSYTLSETNGELKVTATDKTGWEAVNLTFEPLQLEENPYLSVKIKADSNVNVRFNFVDVNGTWTDRYNQGYEIIADGTYHNYVFDFSNKWVNYQNTPVHPNQIVEMTMQFNMSDYFNGEVYFDDLKIGADAVVNNNLDLVFVEITNDCNASTADSVKVHVANTGLNALTNFDLSVSADSNQTLTESITSTLNPGDTGVYLMSGTFDFYHNNYVNNYAVVGQVSHPDDENVVDNEVSFAHKQFGDYTDRQGWTSYNSCDGLADNNVWAVVEDVNGDIWMSGFKGITRFDGTNFTRYYVEDGLAGNYSWTMEAASDGTVWMPASDGGFTSYKDGVFTEHYPLDSLAFEECSFEDEDGNVWFGSYSNNGVIMYDGSTWTHFPTEIGAIVEDIDHAPNGDLLFANQGSVIRYDGSTFTEFLINDTARYISEIFRDDSGITWFYGPNGLFSFNGSTFNNYSGNVADAGYVQAIEQDAAGNIWFGGYSGAIKYDGTNWEYFLPGDGLIPSQVWSIQGAADGNIWMGTRLGVSVYNPTPMVDLLHNVQWVPWDVCTDSSFTFEISVINAGLNTVYSPNAGYSINGTEQIFEIIADSILSGDTINHVFSKNANFYTNNYSENFQVTSYVNLSGDMVPENDTISRNITVYGDYTDMQGWTSYNSCDGLADNNVWAVVEDVNGDIWMSGFKGITRFDGTNFTQYYVEDGLAGNYSWTMEVASDGTVWMPATTGGFTSYKDGVFTTHYPFDSLVFEECSFEDNDGNLWFGSYDNNGVAMYDGANWTHYPTEIGAIIEDIDHAPNGDLLFANQGSVIRYDGSTFSELLINDTTRYVNEIFHDASGTTWFYGVSRLFSYDGSNFMDYSDKVGNAGYVQAIEQDAAGNIWFGGSNGAVRYDGANWDFFASGDGLIPSQVWSIQGASNGNIWFGTRLGASVYSPTPLVDLFHRAQFIPRNTCADSTYYIEVQFVNAGLETLINPKAGFTVNNGTPVIETIADTLFSNDTVNYVFAQPANLYTTDYSQNFHVTTFASVDGDLVTENDTISRAINVFGDYEDKPGWESFNTCNGLIDANVWSMVQDESGDIWATSFYGINRISEDSITTYTTDDGLADNYSWTSLAASDGSLWFPSVSGGFTVYNSGTFETLYPLDSLTFAECSFEDNQGNLWFGSYDGFGVAMYDGSSWTHYPTEVSDIVVDIDQLPSGEILFGTFNGVVSYDGTSFSSYLVNGTDLIMNEIYTDSQGRTWFIGSGQAHMLDNGTWTEYTDNLSLIGYVESIDEDAFGSLWFGGSQGVMSFDGTTWKMYAADNGLVPGPIYSVLGAQDGSVWFGSYQQGLSKFANQVVAKFNFEVNDQTVEFFNQSFALSPVYNWNFGDGGQSQAANPVHTYTNPGYYDVCLTVFDEVTNRSHKLCQEIQVGDTAQVCKVEFDYTVSSDTVDFYDISSDTFTSYFWNFGDGQFSEEMNPRHIYDQGGYFDVILQAYDSTTSCYDEMMQTIYVESVDAENCLAGYDYIVSEGTVTFVNTSQGDYTDVLWSFGDGNYSVIKDTVVHIYTESDYYEVCVTVYDSATGCLDESCQDIQVSINEEQLCNADFTYFVEGNLVDFTSTAQGQITDYMWDFGDGNFAFEASPEHEYTQPGFYEVEFTVFDSATNCLDFKQKVVMVTEGAEAVCNAGFEFYVNNNNVVFNNTSTGNFTDIFWDFGDGMYTTDSSPTHIYQNPDYYEVSLTVYDETTGCLDEFTDVVFVASETEPSCNASFSYQSNQNTVNFANNSIGAVTDYFWDFGDGNYSVEKSPQHVFDESGYFEVNLTIYNDTNNCLDEFTEVVFVYNPEVTYCNAKFSYYPQGSTISFTSEATGGFTQYFWDFDDGKNSNNLNPVHTYEEPGYYEVAFTVLDTTNGCFDTRYKVIFVEGDGGTGTASSEIKAAYSYFPNSSNNQVTFTDESYGDVTNWYWNFGDNSPASNEQHPVYTYATNDYYRVCLTASNAERQKTKCKFIAVGDVSNSSTSFFNYFADSITSTAHFKNKSLGNIVAYHWDFGDGYSSDKKNPSHTYADTGYYAVCLTTISATDVEKTYCKDVRIGNAIDNPCLYSCVWPGDANNDLEANHYDVMTIGLNYGMQGPQREVSNINWYGQFAQNWSTYQLDGTNNKYGDCNGDGVINFDDIAAIEKNFAFSHYFQPDVKNAQWLIACEWVNEQSKASKRKAKAILSPPSSKSKSEIYAIAYEIEVVGGEKIIWNTIEASFENSWIGQAGLDMFTVFQTDSTENMIFIGMTRIDQQNVAGSGEIAELTFEFKDGVQPNGVSFNVTTKGGIESTGESVTVDGSIALDLGEELSACQGEPVILDAGSGFDSYEWSTGATDTSRIEVFGAGAYYVTVTDSTGAEASDTILVNVYSLPNVDLGNDVEVNDSVILDAGSGFSTYLWSTGEQTENITVNETGEYWVEVSNENGCTSRDTVSVTIKTDINNKRTKELTVFPNPNNGKFWLVYEFNSTTPFVVEIINVDGSTVWRNEFDSRNGIKALIGDDSLSEGVYYLRLVHNNEANTIRFVVL